MIAPVSTLPVPVDNAPTTNRLLLSSNFKYSLSIVTVLFKSTLPLCPDKLITLPLSVKSCTPPVGPAGPVAPVVPVVPAGPLMLPKFCTELFEYVSVRSLPETVAAVMPLPVGPVAPVWSLLVQLRLLLISLM